MSATVVGGRVLMAAGGVETMDAAAVMRVAQERAEALANLGNAP